MREFSNELELRSFAKAVASAAVRAAGIVAALAAVTAAFAALAAVLAEVLSSPADATVFDATHFVEPGEYALGVEPILILSDGAGFGANLRPTYGIDDLNNVSLIVGYGGGPRAFRLGADMTFDFFPDVEGQPGIGLMVQGIYYRIPTDAGLWEFTGAPYLHKAFELDKQNEVEPFVAFPIGLDLSQGQYKAVASAAFGAMFKNRDHFRYVLEVGLSINNAESYISGGVVYYH